MFMSCLHLHPSILAVDVAIRGVMSLPNVRTVHRGTFRKDKTRVLKGSSTYLEQSSLPTSII